MFFGVRVIKVIYGSKGFIGCHTPKNWHSVCLDILKSVERLNFKGVDLLPLCKKKLGDDGLTMFWDDIWLGYTPLKSQFPRVYALDLAKQATAKHKVGQVSFLSSLRRSPRGAENCQFR